MTTRYKSVRVSDVTFKRFKRLAAELSERTGLNVTMADTCGRASQALEDNHRDRRWLTGQEAARDMERRHFDTIASVIGQMIAALRPSMRVVRIAIDPEHSVIAVEWQDEGDRGELTIPLGMKEMPPPAKPPRPC